MNMRLGEHTQAGSGNIKIQEAYTSQSKLGGGKAQICEVFDRF
jgi:hypothetical protein